MSKVSNNLALEFSSSERRKGETLFRDRSVKLGNLGDTFVSATVRSSIPGHVTFTCEEVGGPSIRAKCSCAVYRKGDLCRHAWAVLLELEDRGADFLDGKAEIARERAGTAELENDDAYKEKQKALAKEYRKQQSAKQKEIRKQSSARNNDLLRTPNFEYPHLVEKARRYFQSNGYAMKQPIEITELIEAKKHLSRVFHPDKGGSHEEILELNENFQIISDYLKV